MTNVIPIAGDDEEGVVDEEVQEDLTDANPGKRTEAEHEHRDEQRNVAVSRTDLAGIRSMEAAPSLCNRGSAHAVTSRGCSSPATAARSSGCSVCLRWNTFARKAGDWMRQTIVTTSALNTRIDLGGTPME